MNTCQDFIPCRKTFLVLILLVIGSLQGKAQQISNLRYRYVSLRQDSIKIDSLSIIPGSVALWNDTLLMDPAAYHLDESRSILTWNRNSTAFSTIGADSLRLIYRVFPLSFVHTFRHKDRARIEKQYKGVYNPFEYNEKSDEFDIFKLQGLSHTGSISRGVSFGNAQDVVVNSSLNLQLSGKLNENVEILASVTDNNIPIQPEGNTQQIQDFDKVFIQLSNQNNKLIAGDFELTRPESYFMNFYKKGQGGVYFGKINLTPEKDTAHFHLMHVTLSASISKGKYARQVFQGAEGNQGPYRLTGTDNELYIVILSGSERIYIDGQLMVRGQEYDYVIDYNTAQLTFTSRRLITKDSRITAEFQYSDKNYSRSLIYANDTYTQKNLRLRLNVYSEQDAKNQPLLQTIDDAQKQLLALTGDNIQNAFYPNVDSVPFNTNEVLYVHERDTTIGTITYPVYVHSNNPDSAHLRIGFSFVGNNGGNYNPVYDSTNGKVYVWVDPVDVNGVIVKQGAYDPITLLITPKKQQMLSLGVDYALGKNTTITVEGAGSNYDQNLYSSLDDGDNTGFAGSGIVKHVQPVRKDWKLITAVQAEHVDERFKPVEAFRSVEFARDWNLGPNPLTGNENSGSISAGIAKATTHFLNYQFKTFQKGIVYKGYMHLVNLGTTWKGFTLLADGSYLTTNGSLVKSNYLRDKADLSKRIKKWVIGANGMQERNSILEPVTDTLLYSSFLYNQWQAYLTLADSGTKKFRTDYTQRYDYTPRNNQFKLATVSDNASVNLELQPNANSRLETGAIYRHLRVNDSTLTALKSENSILSHLQLDFTTLKGAIVFNTYYEVGTGQELKNDYSFIEVAAGTGSYIWNDYNNSGTKEINEFEVAAFVAEANYIKIFTPTNEYIKTHTNLLSQVMNINPAAFFKQGKTNFLSRFNDQLALKIDNKTTDPSVEAGLNPFSKSVSESALISTNSSVRNTIFFNRSYTLFGMDFTYQELRNKALLANGFESRSQQSVNGNARWNITKILDISMFGENGYKKNNSQLSAIRDFNIRFGSILPKLSLQPNNNFRATFSYEYQIKRNSQGEIQEKSSQDDFGIELKYSSLKKGVITGKVNYINISYNALDNTSISYEMLEGLKTGKNLTWGAGIQRNLGNSLQLNLNYEGRKSPEVKTVHTGGVQLTAYF